MNRLCLTSIMLVFVMGSITCVSADILHEKITRGNQLYQADNFQQALQTYDQARTETEDHTLIDYNRANCFYQLNDYDQAIDLYRTVAADSKDMNLVGRAKFNLGNCYYRKGMKHKDGDLQKTLEFFETCVSFYRDVLDIDPDDAEARKNIAVVRLQMKHIADTLKKRQEMAEKEKNLFEKLKELPEEQMALLRQTVGMQQNMVDPNRPTTVEKSRLLNIAGDQNELKGKTHDALQESQQMLDEMLNQTDDQGQPIQIQDPCALRLQKILETVNRELPVSIDHQDEAARYMHQGLTPNASREQHHSWQALLRALEAFPKKEQPQNQQQQQQQNQQDQQSQNQQEQEQQPDEQQGQDQQQQIEQAVTPDATAREILNDERERRKERDRRQNRGPRFSTTGKDW